MYVYLHIKNFPSQCLLPILVGTDIIASFLRFHVPPWSLLCTCTWCTFFPLKLTYLNVPLGPGSSTYCVVSPDLLPFGRFSFVKTHPCGRFCLAKRHTSYTLITLRRFRYMHGSHNFLQFFRRIFYTFLDWLFFYICRWHFFSCNVETYWQAMFWPSLRILDRTCTPQYSACICAPPKFCARVCAAFSTHTSRDLSFSCHQLGRISNKAQPHRTFFLLRLTEWKITTCPGGAKTRRLVRASLTKQAKTSVLLHGIRLGATLSCQ